MNFVMAQWAFAAMLCIGAAAAFAQNDLHDDARHRSAVEHGEHLHAHPGVDLSHPIVIESPVPETHLRLDYNFADGDEGSEHAISATAEYALMQNFSMEAVLPYVFVDPDDGDGADRLGDAIIAAKLATYAFVDKRILPAIGVEVVLPTGNEERGIGTDHVVELEPFARVGYWAGPVEVIGAVSIGIPFNQTDEEKDEEDFALGYGVSALYRATRDVQALVELHGQSIFGDDDNSEFYISPGILMQPFSDKSISIGLGATLPVTNDEELDYAINVMAIVHF